MRFYVLYSAVVLYLSVVLTTCESLRLRQSKLAISASAPTTQRSSDSMRFKKSRDIDHELTAKAGGCPHVNGTVCSDRGECVQGSCMCKKEFFGVACEFVACSASCSKNGFCDEKTGKCTCRAGYTGEACEKSVCQDDCGGHGICTLAAKSENGESACSCFAGWQGPACDKPVCPNFCSGHGACGKNSTCTCQPGWTSAPDCSVEGCVGDCGDKRGRCDMDSKTCVCNHGYTGKNCERSSCLNDCSNHGTCKEHRCECNAGYSGADCSVKTCSTSCGIHGVCDSGTCKCEDGWSGIACTIEKCDPECENGGICLDNVCHCPDSFTGSTCSDRTCSKTCEKHGVCDPETGECLCDYMHWGKNCELEACPGSPDPSPLKFSVTIKDGEVHVSHNKDGSNDRRGGWLPQGVSLQASLMCSGHGICSPNTKKCTCSEGWIGEDCASSVCPNDCNGGECTKDGCKCDDEHTGNACQFEKCPSSVLSEDGKNYIPCGGFGDCIHGNCHCHQNHSGVGCELCVGNLTGPHCDQLPCKVR